MIHRIAFVSKTFMICLQIQMWIGYISKYNSVT